MGVEQLLPVGASLDSVGGVPLRDIADRFGTPAYVVDEATLRHNARAYGEAFGRRHDAVDVHFASKAFPCSAVIGVFADEGLGCDVVGTGELAIALAGGMPGHRILLHGNAKRDADLKAALEAGVEYVVIDGSDDVDRLERLADRPQPVLLRVNPEVEAETHEALATGHGGSKFGVGMEEAGRLIARLRGSRRLRLDGLHAHIGSQLLDLRPFEQAVEAVAALGSFEVYDLGGGLGAAYLPDDEVPTVDAYAERLVGAVHRHLGREVKLIVEPGRSLVARAGLTVYTVVTVKRGARTFVAVDGGMGDNLEPMMYGVRFAPFVLGGGEPEVADLVGPHCETGDVLVRDATLARTRVGDLVVMPVTGAYCHSLANNYNGALRPPVVLCGDAAARVVVRRERLDDLLGRNR